MTKAGSSLVLWAVLLGTLPAAAQDTGDDAAEEAVSSQPATTQPSSPATTQPTSTQPATTGSGSTQPAATESAATQPTTTVATTSRPAPFPPAVPGAPLSLNFKDAPLRSVLEYLSEAAGLVIVEAAPVEGRVTVMSRQQLSVEEAVSLLDTLLQQKGLAAIRADTRTLKIVTIEQARKELIPVRSGNDPEKIQPSDRMVTQIIPIRSADAVKLKTDLAALVPASANVTSNASSNTLIVTGTEATVRRVVEIIRAIDVHMASVTQVKVFQLKYANAANAARLITEIFREDQTGQTPTSPFGGGRRAFMVSMGGPGGPPGGGDETGQRGVKVTASADERTNTLVVSASPDVLKVIEGVVKDLDADPAVTQAVFVFRLKNAQAKNLESVLNSIFGWSGSSTTLNRQTSGTTGGAVGTGSAFGGRTTGGGIRGLGSGTTGGLGTARTGTGGTGTGGTGAGRTGFTGAQGRTTGGLATGGRALSPTAGAAASDLAGQVYVVADEDTNSLLITTASKNFERVTAIINELDRPVPQVLIKVLIAEVTHDKSLDLGVEFSLLNLRAANHTYQIGTDFSVAAQKGGFMFKLSDTEVAAAIRAIAGVAKLDVLSRPYILTGDNQPATIMVGQELPFITYSQITTEGTVNNTINYVDIGIILQVTPHINPQGLVTMDVYPEISEPTGERVPLNPQASSPVIARRFAQSRVAIRDGHTIVIGGLMEDRITKSVDKVPLLGDIPLLGLLFSRTIETKTKTELLIFITPHVAQQPDDLPGMSEAEKAGTKIIQDAVEKGAFQEHLKGMERGASTRPAVQDTEPRVFEVKPTSLPAAGDYRRKFE